MHFSLGREPHNCRVYSKTSQKGVGSDSDGDGDGDGDGDDGDDGGDGFRWRQRDFKMTYSY